MTKFARRLKRYRQRARLSVRQAAEACRTSTQRIYQIESGDGYPSLVLAGRMADAYGVSIDDIRKHLPESKR